MDSSIICHSVRGAVVLLVRNMDVWNSLRTPGTVLVHLVWSEYGGPYFRRSSILNGTLLRISGGSGTSFQESGVAGRLKGSP